MTSNQTAREWPPNNNKKTGKGEVNLYSATSRICRLSGAVRHREGQRSA